MKEAKIFVLSDRQQEVSNDAKALIESGIGEQCDGCSTAKFKPGTIARAVAIGNVPVEMAQQTAEQFRACEGLGKIGTANLCHFPSKAVESPETPDFPDAA
jgi:hypothetical protein